ncbi:hypothetical protein BaRGS_00030728 [Batillaria attramentaria]|uniref:Transmembrane protein n=1 Tax=Batillaria attramentaria TaxID=370345 RepID=A0ABD0JTU5_9CAEN
MADETTPLMDEGPCPFLRRHFRTIWRVLLTVTVGGCLIFLAFQIPEFALVFGVIGLVLAICACCKWNRRCRSDGYSVVA